MAHEQGDLLEQRPETEEIFVRSRRVVVAMMWGLEDEVGWTGLDQPWMIYVEVRNLSHREAS